MLEPRVLLSTADAAPAFDHVAGDSDPDNLYGEIRVIADHAVYAPSPVFGGVSEFRLNGSR